MDNKLKKILIIEDEAPLLDTYAEILTNEGYEVIQTPDGYKGLESLEVNKESIGLVFLDLMMQGIDGLETLKRIRTDSNKYGIPHIIVLTNMTSEMVIKESFAIGANSYLIKSELDAEDLLKEAKAVLGVPVVT